MPPLIAQLLYNRGVRDQSQARAFLDTSWAGSGDPFLLPNADRAVDRLARAIDGRETIAIFGDFDADGVTASAVLYEGLRPLGVRVVPYIPDRVEEGHGLNLKAIQYLKGLGVTVLVTADCGITSVAEVAAAADLGMDTIITDHHSPPASLPDAVALVNPKLKGASLALADLAACGVAYKLMEALYLRLGRDHDESLLEFVALGTVADLAPMGPANRALVRRGIGLLNRTSKPGLLALLKVSGMSPGDVDTEAIAYTLGPRINAPGRIDHADASYQLLVSTTPEEAAPLAARLNERNAQRQQITREILEDVKRKLEQPLRSLIMVGDAAYPPGVVGLVAGKLTEEYHRPSIVFQEGPVESRASCRSIPEFNIIEALRQCDGLFSRYGGHAQAAGFTIATTRLAELRRRLTEIAARALDPAAFIPRIRVDAHVRLERLTGDVIRAMRDLAPHGPINPAPTLLCRGVEVKDFKAMGAEGQHVRLKLKAGGVTWSAVAFNTDLGETPPAALIDLVFTLSVNRWNGSEGLQMRVLDMAPSSPAPRLL